MRTFTIKLRSDECISVSADEVFSDAQFVYFNAAGKLSALVSTPLVASVMESHLSVIPPLSDKSE